MRHLIATLFERTVIRALYRIHANASLIGFCWDMQQRIDPDMFMTLEEILADDE